jgi:hypothetical protein
MCGIVGSPVFTQAVATATALKSRGTRSWSLSLVDLDTFSIVHAQSERYAFHESAIAAFITEVANPYYIFHLQSPTAEDYHFHPAVLSVNDTNHYLWHNGMMDSSEHAKFSRTWDTQLLLELLVDKSGNPQFNRLSEFQGSFACYYLKEGEGLYVFRNRISPQYFDPSTNSYASVSTKGHAISPNTVFNMVTGLEVTVFENSYNPFGV